MKISRILVSSLLKIILLILVLMLVAFPLAAQEPSTNDYTIYLSSRTFTPAAGPDSLAVQAGENEGQQHLLVQLWTIPTEEERTALASAGVTLLGYIPNHTWLASTTGPLDLSAPPYNLIRWAGPLTSEDKMAPSLRQQGVGPWAIGPDGQVQLYIQFFDDVLDSQARSVIARYSGQIHSAGPVSPRYVAWFPEADVINALAAEDSVQWIESGPRPKSIREDPSGTSDDGPITIQNNLARARTGVDTLFNLGIKGNGVVVAVTDGGPVASHPDFTGRLTISAQTIDPVDTDGGGHATHVAGTVAGDGQLSAGFGGSPNQWRGVAPEANIVSYSFQQDVEAGLQEAIQTYQIDVSQNSWGDVIDNGNCSLYGDYTSTDKMFDEIITGKYGKRIVAAIAIGNDRADDKCGQSTIPPYLNYRTVGPPSGAKNSITVGATLSEDDAMTDFSDWGPTDDGRLKPDLVAPGSSNAQQIISTIVGGAPGNYTYAYGALEGTSMATPHVSGIAALVIQRYKAVFGQSPLPSTVKALLLHTAVDLVGTSFYQTGPDYASGYGRVDALAAYNAIIAGAIKESQASNGQTIEYTFAFTGTSPVKVTLAWDDPAAEPNSSGNKRLINDLDLELVSPDSTTYLPWVLDPNNPSAAATTGVDALNNVEQVVATGATGTWTVRVKGTSVPQGPQNFSLMIPGTVKVNPTNTYLPLIIK